jgi:hypothetical protein
MPCSGYGRDRAVIHRMNESQCATEDMSLVVLAAGMGSRYGGLKQIEPVGPNGELLIEYSIYDAISAGIHDVVFVVQPEQEAAFRALLAGKLKGRCCVRYVHQKLDDVPNRMGDGVKRHKPWGTGHAVWSCRDALRGALLVINADDFYGRESYVRMMDFWSTRERSGAVCAMVAFDLEKTLTPHGKVSRGVCRVDDDGFLVRIDERTHIGLYEDSAAYWDEEGRHHLVPEASIASMNMWAFPNAFLRTLGVKLAQFFQADDRRVERDEFYLPQAVNDLIEERRIRVRVLQTAAEWMGVTYRADIPRVREGIRELIGRGAYPQNLWSGIV